MKATKHTEPPVEPVSTYIVELSEDEARRLMDLTWGGNPIRIVDHLRDPNTHAMVKPNADAERVLARLHEELRRVGAPGER